ncbi:MAG: hypothetical protein QOD98_3006 [Nocardioidaceae bacterium]|jgi:hypothetical protein|nr:hypothetical protein [Nocardioidaceae bacterium]
MDPAEDRLAALEARVSALEARLGPPPAADETGAWLDQVAGLAATGDRAGAISVYRENMASDEQEAASFVDDLIAKPPTGP